MEGRRNFSYSKSEVAQKGCPLKRDRKALQKLIDNFFCSIFSNYFNLDMNLKEKNNHI